MWNDIGNKIRMALYALMAILGFTQVVTTFSLLMAFQIEVFVLVLLYKWRPKRAILRKHPDGNVVMIGMMPFLLFFYFIIVIVSNENFTGNFREPLKEEIHLLIPILAVQVIAAIVDRSIFQKDERIWAELPSKIVQKVIILWVLSLTGIGVVYWGGSSKIMLLPFLMIVRMVLEIHPILGYSEKTTH